MPADRRTAIATHAFVAAVCVFTTFPVLWAVTTSFKRPTDIYGPDLLPPSPTLENYVASLQTFPILRLLLTTACVATAVAGVQLVLAILAAYGLVRFDFKGNRAIFLAFVAAILVPQQVLIVPNYLLTARLGLLDTYVGLAAPQIAGCAVGIILLRQHLRAFPRSLLDAAEIDGARHTEVLWRIVVPNLRPLLAALGIIFFITSWNEYLWPLLVASDPRHATVQVGLQAFQTEQGNAWGRMMAAATLVTAPVLLAYTLAQRWIIDAFLRAGLR